MDIAKKRKHQKLAKLFYILGYACIGLFILSAIVNVVYTVKSNKTMIENDAVLIVTFFAPILFAAVFAVLGSYQTSIYMNHHRKVKYWRHCRMFGRIIELETTNHHDKAIELYNKLPKSTDRDILYGFIIGYSQNSNDPTLKKDAALNNFNDYKSFYRLEDIFK